MKRLALIPVCLALCLFQAQAKVPVKFSAEWGYDGMFHTAHHFNYICNEGYRIDDKWQELHYNTNGNILISAGVEITGKSAISIESGITGICRDGWVVPVMLQYTLAPRGNHQPGIIYRADAGIGLHLNGPDVNNQRACYIAKASAGYRNALNSRFSLDFLGGIRAVLDFPLIKDPDTHEYLSKEKTRRSIASYCAFCLSVSFNF